MVIHVLPPGFCRRPVSLRPSAFARQPSPVSLRPVGLCSSAVLALVPSRFALAFGDGWRGVDGVALASLGLRDGFGFALGKAAARAVGKLIAERAKAKGIDTVVFDRGGYLYHGRVAELAEGAREGGLEF